MRVINGIIFWLLFSLLLLTWLLTFTFYGCLVLLTSVFVGLKLVFIHFSKKREEGWFWIFLSAAYLFLNNFTLYVWLCSSERGKWLKVFLLDVMKGKWRNWSSTNTNQHKPKRKKIQKNFTIIFSFLLYLLIYKLNVVCLYRNFQTSVMLL